MTSLQDSSFSFDIHHYLSQSIFPFVMKNSIDYLEIFGSFPYYSLLKFGGTSRIPLLSQIVLAFGVYSHFAFALLGVRLLYVVVVLLGGVEVLLGGVDVLLGGV